MNRRNFLKLFMAGAASAAMPKLLLAEPQDIIHQSASHIGNVRETIIYDLRTHIYVVRHDIMCGERQGNKIIMNRQYGIDSMIKDMDELESVRKEMLDILK